MKRPSYGTRSRSTTGSRRPRPNPLMPSCAASAATAVMMTTAAARTLRQPDHTPVPPLRAEQADEQHQHERYVPELVLFARGPPAPAVAQVVGKRRDVVSSVVAPAGLLGDPPQRRGVHRRIEVLDVTWRRAEVRHARADRLPAAGGLDAGPVPTRGAPAN